MAVDTLFRPTRPALLDTLLARFQAYRAERRRLREIRLTQAILAGLDPSVLRDIGYPAAGDVAAREERSRRPLDLHAGFTVPLAILRRHVG